MNRDTDRALPYQHVNATRNRQMLFFFFHGDRGGQQTSAAIVPKQANMNPKI